MKSITHRDREAGLQPAHGCRVQPTEPSAARTGYLPRPGPDRIALFRLSANAGTAVLK